MNINEIRIGNIVHKTFKCGFSRETHTIVARDFVCFNRKEYKPIKLTESALQFYGFERIDNPNKTQSYLYIKDGKSWLVQSHNDKKIYLASCDYRVRVKHVHQLQNLYFELTGNELCNTY